MKKISLNKKDNKVIAITLASWGIIMIATSLFIGGGKEPIIKTSYSVAINEGQVMQFKTNEIKLKDIEIEINQPISVDIKDYLVDINNLSEETLKALKLDTSLVNINEAGTYQYKIIYKKKTYVGNVKVKQKELPNITFTLKTIKLKTKEAISSNPRSFINEEISDEVYNNITLDISKVDTSQQGDYTYYIIYKGVTYQGKVEVRDPGPTIITPSNPDKPEEELTCPEDATNINNRCICKDTTKLYDEETKQCI
jgi:hypothetical protein